MSRLFSTSWFKVFPFPFFSKEVHNDLKISRKNEDGVCRDFKVSSPYLVGVHRCNLSTNLLL